MVCGLSVSRDDAETGWLKDETDVGEIDTTRWRVRYKLRSDNDVAGVTLGIGEPAELDDNRWKCTVVVADEVGVKSFDIVGTAAVDALEGAIFNLRVQEWCLVQKHGLNLLDWDTQLPAFRDGELELYLRNPPSPR